MTKDCATRWLSLLCSMIPGVRTAYYVNAATPTCEQHIVASYPDGATPNDAIEALVRDTLVAQEEIARPVPGVAIPSKSWALARLVAVANSVGVVALEFDDTTQEQLAAIGQLVAWAGQWATLAQPAAMAVNRHEPDLNLANVLLEAATLDQALAKACRHLSGKFGGTRVAIGLHAADAVSLAAVSDRAAFDRRTQSADLYTVAMNEAFDQSRIVAHPHTDTTVAAVSVGHRKLADAERSCACSVPLGTSGDPAGIVTLLRAESKPFTDDDMAMLQPYAALLGHIIHVRRRAEQGPWRRLRQSMQSWRKHWLMANAPRRRMAVVGAAAVIAFLALGSAPYQVGAPAVLAGTSERTLAAPVDGYLSEVHVRPGARVASGQILATLDPAPLERQRRQLQGQRSQLNGEYNVALGKLDGAAARILQSQLAQTHVQIEHLDAQLSRLNITAPFDGLVLDGDLMHAAGGPVALGDTLFRLTPNGGYLVRLHVSASDVEAIGIGARGRLKLAALPNAQLDIEVVRINGIAQTVDGRSVLEMEATVHGNQDYLRPGMKGVARLDAGHARVLWIWTHSIWQRMKLWLWRFSPVA